MTSVYQKNLSIALLTGIGDWHETATLYKNCCLALVKLNDEKKKKGNECSTRDLSSHNTEKAL